MRLATQLGYVAVNTFVFSVSAQYQNLDEPIRRRGLCGETCVTTDSYTLLKPCAPCIDELGSIVTAGRQYSLSHDYVMFVPSGHCGRSWEATIAGI